MNNDLISRSALLEDFEWIRMTVGYGSVSDIDDAIERIKKAPAVDAEPVVRCKDCVEYIHWGDDGNRICGRIGSYFGNTKPNDFCSRGAKMDVEG